MSPQPDLLRPIIFRFKYSVIQPNRELIFLQGLYLDTGVKIN